MTHAHGLAIGTAVVYFNQAENFSKGGEIGMHFEFVKRLSDLVVGELVWVHEDRLREFGKVRGYVKARITDITPLNPGFSISWDCGPRGRGSVTPLRENEKFHRVRDEAALHELLRRMPQALLVDKKAA